MKCLKRRAIARKTTELIIFLKPASLLLTVYNKNNKIIKLRIYLVLANFNTDVRAIAIIISSIRYMRATSGRVLFISLVIFRISKYS